MPYISVDLGQPEIITGIATRGQPDVSHWVTKFTVSTSVDGITFEPYKDSQNANQKVFGGNYDRDTIVYAFFDRAVNASAVRIYPIEWHEAIALRFDVLACYGLATPPTINPGSPTPYGVSTGSSTQTPTPGPHDSPTPNSGQTGTTPMHTPPTPFTVIPGKFVLPLSLVVSVFM